MAHEISRTPDGRDSMVYVGETPWHRRGTRLEASDGRNLDLVFEKAGLGFEVTKRPRHELEVLGPDDPGPADLARDGVRYRLNRAEKPFSLVRSDTGAELGSVGDAWHPLQNREAFEPLRAALDDGVASIETGGVLRDGKEVWMLVRFDRDHVLRTARARPGKGSGPAFRRLMDTLEGEPGGGILPYGLFYNDHSGTRDARVQQTAVRVVCANTLEYSLRRRERSSVEIPHRRTVRRAYAHAVRNLFRGVVHGCQELAEHRDVLKRTVLSEDDFSRLVLEVAVPLGLLERIREQARDTLRSAWVDRLTERSRARRAEIRRLWESGAGHQGDRSAWEAWNGLVQWADHSASAAPEAARIGRLMTGELGRTKRQVFAHLLAHASGERKGAEPPSLAAELPQERCIPAERDLRARIQALKGTAIPLDEVKLPQP
jgi:hypothetical protein